MSSITKFIIMACVLSSLQAKEDLSNWLLPKEVPAPKDNQITPERVELGKLLYFDVRLSSSEEISCATCHHPHHGWSDENPTPKAVGHEGAVGPRNSPTVLNTAFQMHQFWDGRVRTLEEQALGPIEADVEMNLPVEQAVAKIANIDGYVKLFEKAYPGEGVTADTLAKAIATFERTVISTESPFDRYAKGDKEAISKEAKKGFELFTGKAKCFFCHSGGNFTDGSFHNIGLNDGELHGKELGRYLVKRRAGWYGVMKTPTLRDVTKTSPYFHDGSVKTLHEATAICGNGGRYKHNVKNKSYFMEDRNLTSQDIEYLVEFMKSLEGPDLDIKIPTQFPQ